MIDTGGIDLSRRDFFSEAIKDIVEKSLKEADLILFVVDAKEGLTSADEEIASYLRRFSPVLLIANKVEGKEDEKRAQEFFLWAFLKYFLSLLKRKETYQLLKIDLKKSLRKRFFPFLQQN